MTGFTSSLQNVLGTDADAYPLLAERIAIDTTNTLRGAEIWPARFPASSSCCAASGVGYAASGQELQAAIGQDLIAVQRATLVACPGGDERRIADSVLCQRGLGESPRCES